VNKGGGRVKNGIDEVVILHGKGMLRKKMNYFELC